MKPPIITTQAGKVQGKWEVKGTIASFKGIPYAAPPVGALRWKAPQPLQPWEGIKKTTKFSAFAWQFQVFIALFLKGIINGQGWSWLHRMFILLLTKIAPSPKQSEDCLYLNIKTPNIDESAKLPVMVWIHGGDHQDGSGAEIFYDGVAIPNKGIVYVSINYRLGLLGYFAHPELTQESEHQVSGNYGTLDQIAALQWVQDNIAAFGGDPNNVTIFGESAGGESVAHMLTSPLAKGLFHKAILQSPANGGQMIHLSKDFEHIQSAEGKGLAFAKAIGVTGSNQVEQLRKMSAKQLMTFLRKQEPESNIMTHYPNIDGYVLPQSPFAAFADNNQANVPILLGSNSDEGTCLYPIFELPQADYQPLGLSDKEVVERFHHDFKGETQPLLALYPGLKNRDHQAEIAFLGDNMFGAKARWYAKHHAQNGNPIYYYFFKRVPPSPTQTAGAYHAAELPFVHGTDVPILPLDKQDKVLSAIMIDYWTNFAKTGNPNGHNHPEWLSFDTNNPQWMVLDNNNMGMNTVEREKQYQLLMARLQRQVEAMKGLE